MPARKQSAKSVTTTTTTTTDTMPEVTVPALIDNTVTTEVTPSVPMQGFAPSAEVEKGTEAAGKRRDLLAKIKGQTEAFQRGYAALVAAVLDGEDWKYSPDESANTRETYVAKYVKPEDMKIANKDARVALVTDLLRQRPELPLKTIAVITGTATAAQAEKNDSLGSASRDRKQALAAITTESLKEQRALTQGDRKGMTAEQRKEAEKALRETVKSATEETFDASAPESGPANPVMGNINVQAQFTPKTIKSKNGGKPRTMRKSDWTDAIRDEAKAAAKKAVAEVLRSHGIEVAE